MANKRAEEEGEHLERGDRVIDNFQIHALGFPPRPWASRWAHSLLEADAYCPGPIRQQWSHHEVICHLEIPGLCLIRCALVPPHWTWLSRVIYCTTCGLVGTNNVEVLVTSPRYTLSPPFSPGFKMFLFPPLQLSRTKPRSACLTSPSGQVPGLSILYFHLRHEPDTQVTALCAV